MNRTRRVLVTGGAGFIGSHLVDALVRAGHRVTVLDDFSSGHRSNLADAVAADDDVEIAAADLRDFDAVFHAMQGCDAVFHLGALGSVPRSVAEPIPTHQVNATGSVHVFEAARRLGVRRVVVASSSSVFGDSTASPKREEDLGRLLSPYAASKRTMELYGEAFASLSGVEVVALRYFNVFGPRQSPSSAYAAVIPRFFAAALRGASPVIYGTGEQSRDFTYVGDVVEANLRALSAPLPEGRSLIVNVARGGKITVNELWRAVASLTGASSEPEYRAERPGDILHSCAATERLRSWLGWVPETSPAEGLAASLGFYRELLEV